jgi:hypothetical protein
VDDGRKRADIERGRGVVGGNIAGRVCKLRVTGGGERENGQRPKPSIAVPASLDELFHAPHPSQISWYGKSRLTRAWFILKGLSGRTGLGSRAQLTPFEQVYPPPPSIPPDMNSKELIRGHTSSILDSKRRARNMLGLQQFGVQKSGQHGLARLAGLTGMSVSSEHK